MDSKEPIPYNLSKHWLLLLWTFAVIMFVLSEGIILRSEIGKGVKLWSLHLWFPVMVLTAPLSTGIGIYRAARISRKTQDEAYLTNVNIQVANLVCAAYAATLSCVITW
jgi:hypothetical protein